LKRAKTDDRKDPNGAKWVVLCKPEKEDVLRDQMIPSTSRFLSACQEWDMMKLCLRSMLNCRFQSWADTIVNHFSDGQMSDATSLYSANVSNPANKLPAFTMVGSPANSFEQIAYTSDASVTETHTETAILYGPSSRDKFSRLCFGLGLPKPWGMLQTDEEVELIGDCMEKNPIPFAVVDLLYLTSRMEARHKQDGLASNRLILIDAFTRSDRDPNAMGTAQSNAAHAIQTILGAPDVKLESIRAYRRSMIQMFDRRYTVAARTGSQLNAKKLFKHFRNTPSRLESLDADDLQLAANWGYYLAWQIFETSAETATPPFPNLKTEFNLPGIVWGIDGFASAFEVSS
jgi:hypothetical protein